MSQLCPMAMRAIKSASPLVRIDTHVLGALQILEVAIDFALVDHRAVKFDRDRDPHVDNFLHALALSMTHPPVMGYLLHTATQVEQITIRLIQLSAEAVVHAIDGCF